MVALADTLRVDGPANVVSDVLLSDALQDQALRAHNNAFRRVRLQQSPLK